MYNATSDVVHIFVLCVRIFDLFVLFDFLWTRDKKYSDTPPLGKKGKIPLPHQLSSGYGMAMAQQEGRSFISVLGGRTCALTNIFQMLLVP